MEARVHAHWLLLVLMLRSAARAREPSCQEITVPLCRGIGYNHTYMPNQFHHDSQEEAGLEAHQFWPLVEIRCSADLRFFLCSLYTPICLEDYNKPLPPCRSVCERARAGCAPLMRQYGFPWPERMRCDQLPVQGDPDTLCMDYNRTDATVPPPPPPDAARPTSRQSASGSPECVCRAPLVAISDKHPLHNRVRTGHVANCAVPCHSPFLSAEQRAFASLWIGVWSVLCFLSTSATVATFLLDRARFRYPERPIVFLSACYMLVSVGYVIRLVAGHERVACEHAHVRYATRGPALCTLVFLLVYFFGMASALWWLVLTFTWFLAAGLKWGNEAIARFSPYFHLAAWLVPGVQSAAVLALSSVDGDPVAGICYVGNQDLDNLRWFVLAPLVVYLVMGTVFLFAGLVSMFRIRSVIKQGGTQTDKLERLMIRIGAFAALHTLVAMVTVSCYFYEQHNREAWELAHACQAERSRVTPDYAVFMLKYFMCLLIGVTSGAWTWSGKTVESWRGLCARCCGGGGGKCAGGSVYSDVSTRLTWRSGTGSSVLCPPKQTPLSRL